jgi:phage gp29-like protein
MRARSGILGPNGRPVSAERVRQEKQQMYNPLENLTPDVVVGYLRAFARGEISRAAWLMEWLELHDDTISTVAPKAKAAVSRYGYDVEIKPEVRSAQKKLAEDQKGRCEEFFQNLEAEDAMELEESGGMRLFVQQVMDAYGKRFGAHHIVWKPSRNGLSAKLIKIPTWMFEVTTGRLRFLESAYALTGVDLETMGGRSAWFTAKGRGVMLASIIARMFKQIPLQDWLTYCDRHGMPAFLGKTSAKKGDPGWMEMADAVASIGSEFGAVVNTGDVIDVLNLTGGGDIPYEKLIDRMDRAIVMLWRGGDLSTISRSNGVGSNPQQEDADELDADNSAWVGETIDRQLTKRVVEYYYGLDAPCLVTIKLRTKTRQNVNEDIARAKAAKDMGIRLSKSWLISLLGVQEADTDELAVGETSLPTPPTTTPPPATTTVLNTATDARALLETSLAAALGVRPNVLAPIRPLITDLASRVQDDGISDADFLQLVEDAAETFPELIDSTAIGDLAEQLRAGMGTAAVQGARDAIRDAKKN